MGTFSEKLFFYGILLISFCGLYYLAEMTGQFNDPNLKDVALALGGGVLGALCYALFEKGFLDKPIGKFKQ